MDFDAVIVLGPQGSGKSTQGRRLAEELGFAYWGMGGILRKILEQGGALAAKVQSIKEGALLPDETIIEVLGDRLLALPPRQGVVFDGVPRRMGQARFLIDFLKNHGRAVPVTVFIDVPREVSRARLAARAGAENRADDTPEGIAERLRSYEETMQPVMEYLKKETRFIGIDGQPPVEEVAKRVDAALGIVESSAKEQ